MKSIITQSIWLYIIDHYKTQTRPKHFSIGESIKKKWDFTEKKTKQIFHESKDWIIIIIKLTTTKTTIHRHKQSTNAIAFHNFQFIDGGRSGGGGGGGIVIVVVVVVVVFVVVVYTHDIITNASSIFNLKKKFKFPWLS